MPSAGTIAPYVMPPPPHLRTCFLQLLHGFCSLKQKKVAHGEAKPIARKEILTTFRIIGCKVKKINLFLTLGMSIFIIVSNATAIPVDLYVTRSWSSGDFDVTDPTDSAYDPTNSRFDGKVFGVSPSDGSSTIHLRVETDSIVSFSAGYSYDYLGTTYALEHDFYGYSDVTLVNDPFTFGSATWENGGIITSLIGPDSLGAALRTDTDISVSAPPLLSFRMYGTGDGLTADSMYLNFSGI